MLSCVSSDGRARGLLQYHAAHPGRWGGRLLQPQNFPRGSLQVDPGAAVAAIMTGDPELVEAVIGWVKDLDGNLKQLGAIDCVASSLRYALVPDKGKVFLAGDFAGVEMRVDLALAGQFDKCDLLATGKDVYLDMADDIYRKPKGTLTKKNVAERTIGKNTVLGCGFQMGKKTFHDRYCPHMTLDFADEVVQTYRKVWAPEVPKLWYALEDAALKAAQTGAPVSAYGITYRLEDGWLTARLPSGWQKIWYFRPRLGDFPLPWDETRTKPGWAYDAYKGGRRVRTKAYGGLLTENSVQGLARGLLVASMMRLEQAHYPLVLTVHDEAVCEVDEAKADQHEFEQLMSEPTRWAKEIKIPIAVEAWTGDRYRK